MKAQNQTADETKMTVGSLVRYKEILDKGDETARFVIAEDYGDGRVKVKEITSLTAFGFSTYTRMKDDFALIQEHISEDEVIEMVTEMAQQTL